MERHFWTVASADSTFALSQLCPLIHCWDRLVTATKRGQSNSSKSKEISFISRIKQQLRQFSQTLLAPTIGPLQLLIKLTKHAQSFILGRHVRPLVKDLVIICGIYNLTEPSNNGMTSSDGRRNKSTISSFKLTWEVDYEARLVACTWLMTCFSLCITIKDRPDSKHCCWSLDEPQLRPV